MKKNTAFLCLIFVFIGLSFALEVNRDELRSTENQTIEFVNYTGPHKVIDSLAAIKGIGSDMGVVIARNVDEPRTVGNRAKYYVVHAIDPAEKDKLDADILFLGPNAAVDHIVNLRRIIGAYLSAAYGYSEKDAETIAVFITVYNAVYRGKIDVFNEKYKKVVRDNLSSAGCGLSVNWQEWAGKSEIVIPLFDVSGGGLSTVDTSVISDRKVVKSMQEDDDKNIKARKDMVDIKEREADNASAKAKDAQMKASEEQKKLDEEKAKTDKAQKDADKAQKDADKARKDADNAQREAEMAQKEAENAQTAADEARENVSGLQSEAKDAREIADEAQAAADEAQAAADEAQKLADDMQRQAEETQYLADDMQSQADEAQRLADEARRMADENPDDKDLQDQAREAQRLADEAQRLADEAQREADETLKLADETQAAADKAQREADAAQKEADAAQKEADAAEAAANEAQTAADEAQKDADEAQRLADESRTAADEAQTAADEAQKDAETAREELEEQQQAEMEQEQKVNEAREEAKESQEQADKKNAEAQNERKEIAKDQKEVQDKQIEEEDIELDVGLVLVNDNSLLSRLVKFEKKTGKPVKDSFVASIRNRAVYKCSDGFIAIAGENSGNGAVKLVFIDGETMEIASESEETLSDKSVLVQDDSSYYCVVESNGVWVVAQYDESLKLLAKSSEAVKEATPIMVTGAGIVVTGADGKLKVLSKGDLKPLE